MPAIIITWLLARCLVRILREFASYYNLDRPHRSLDLSPPIRPNVTLE
jgi:transposase InsO family protein